MSIYGLNIGSHISDQHGKSAVGTKLTAILFHTYGTLNILGSYFTNIRSAKADLNCQIKLGNKNSLKPFWIASFGLFQGF